MLSYQFKNLGTWLVEKVKHFQLEFFILQLAYVVLVHIGLNSVVGLLLCQQCFFAHSVADIQWPELANLICEYNTTLTPRVNASKQ